MSNKEGEYAISHEDDFHPLENVEKEKVYRRMDQIPHKGSMILYIMGLCCLAGNLYYTKTIMLTHMSNPVEVVYVGALFTLIGGMLLSIPGIAIRFSSSHQSAAEQITVFSTAPSHRTPIFITSLLMLLGFTLLSYGLENGSLNCTVLNIFLVTPLVAGIVSTMSTPRLGSHWGTSVILLLVLACLVFGSHGQIFTTGKEFKNGTLEPSPYEYQTIIFNSCGAIALGLGFGFYRVISESTDERSGYGLSVIFLNFVAVQSLLLTPALQYRSRAADIQNGVVSEQGVGFKILYFCVSGLLTFFASFSVANAMQHPKIKLADLAIYAAIIPTTVCLCLDFFALNTNIPTGSLLESIAAIVIVLIYCLIVRSYSN